MKRNSLKFLGLMLLALVVASCNPKKMAKTANLVTTECEPQVLEAVAGKIKGDYTVKFPEKYFVKKAILEVTPVMVYEGGEAAGPVLTLQGESILDNNQVISFENGGTVTVPVVFDYVPGMEKATLELRAVVYNKTKTKKFAYPEAYKIADGTNTTYMLVKTKGTPFFEADKYQKIINETKEAQILYLINQYNVRSNQLKNEDVVALSQYLVDLKSDERRTLVSNDIVAYASPDGSQELNNKLSDNRSKSAEKAFNKTINKKAKSEAPVNVKSIGEDWEGFQELVNESNIEDKELILRVLSMYSDPAVREREIKNMSSVYKALAEEVLPELRRARFIANIEYKNYTDEELLDMINTDLDALDEEAILYTATLVESNDIKVTLYEKAASKFNSDRAYNNLAAVKLLEGKSDEAKAALNKMGEKSSSYYNNMAVVAMQKGDYKAAAEYLAKSDVPEVKANKGVLSILSGDYKAAVAELNGLGTFNEALANILVKNEAKASEILKSNCPCQSYLRAIIAARKGDATQANKELEVAAKDENLAKRAKTDIEFAKIK